MKNILKLIMGFIILSGCTKNDIASANNDLIGQWSTSGTTIASYVDASGNFVGDASINENVVYQFNSDGSSVNFAAYTTGFTTKSFLRKGTYTIENGIVSYKISFYEHKINTIIQPNTDPNNTAPYSETFSIKIDEQTQKQYLILDEANGGGWTRLYKAL